MESQFSLWAVLLAGVISFLSPCVFPLVPPYLCFITGASLDELTERQAQAGAQQRRAVYAAVMFVIGFSTVFIALGIGVSVAGFALRGLLPILSKVAGVIIILFGLHFMGILKIPFLNREVRYHHDTPPATLLGAYGIGVAFALGWTPCLGPVLAAIMSYVAGYQDIRYGALLLTVYSLGLGIPFILAALGMGTFLRFLARFRHHLGKVEKLMGALLVATGIMFLTGSMSLLSTWMMNQFPGLANLG